MYYFEGNVSVVERWAKSSWSILQYANDAMKHLVIRLGGWHAIPTKTLECLYECLAACFLVPLYGKVDLQDEEAIYVVSKRGGEMDTVISDHINHSSCEAR